LRAARPLRDGERVGPGPPRRDLPDRAPGAPRPRGEARPDRRDARPRADGPGRGLARARPRERRFSPRERGPRRALPARVRALGPRGCPVSRLFGPYEVVRTLGSGGFARTCEARHALLGTKAC